MKSIDLSKFELVKPSTGQHQKPGLKLNESGEMRINRCLHLQMDETEYVEVHVSQDRRQFLLKKSSKENENALHIRKDRSILMVNCIREACQRGIRLKAFYAAAWNDELQSWHAVYQDDDPKRIAEAPASVLPNPPKKRRNATSMPNE